MALAVFAFSFVDAEHSLTGRPSIDMLLGLGLLCLLVYLWIRLLSGFQKRSQVQLIATFSTLVVGLFAAVQMEGIYGNGRPVFSWRWSSLPADQFVAQSKGSSTPVNRSKLITLPSVAAWPQFRGQMREGISSVELKNWSHNPPQELWRKPIGAGWSSFAIVGDYAFTMEQRGDEECTVCYELNSGNEIWVHRDPERFSEITGGEGPRSTPTFDGGLIYTLGATGVLNCLDAGNGDLLWTVDILVQHEATNCYYGMCSSPLIADDKIIINPGGEAASLVAYNKLNGDLIWAKGDAESSYASPQLVRLCGVPQVLNFNADGLFSHDLKTGTVLWQIPWISNQTERNNVCQPIQISDNRVFISSGYGRGSALFEFSKDRSDEYQITTVWQNKKLRSKFASAIFDGEYIFGLDEGILVCLSAESGQRLWKNGRYYHGQLILAGKHLIVQAENGVIAQVAATADQFIELAQIKALDQRTWNHPVIVDKYLITRNDREVVCFAFE